MKSMGRGVLELVLAVPLLALLLAVVSDRGADGGLRIARFGIVIIGDGMRLCGRAWGIAWCSRR